MEKKNTKQIILEESLNLFSEKGYEVVSVAEIAAAVGIKAPSLYKHYKSKQDIFNAILVEMENRYKNQVSLMQVNDADGEINKSIFLNIGEEQLIEMGKALFLYFLHDKYTSKFRRMLTIEQYRSKELAALYAKQYAEDPVSYQSMVFGLLSGAGALKQENPQIMALHFYAPIFLMLTLCDCHPEKEAEMLACLEKHIRQFNRLYQKGNDI